MESYPYGFNGKESDPESGTQDYGMRIYNPNLGKFLSVDPLKDQYPWNSVYAFAENRPIDGIDLDGAEFLSNALDLLDRFIPVLEQTNAHNNAVDVAKFVRGMGNSTLEGTLRAIVKNAEKTKKATDENPALAKQFLKNTMSEVVKSPEQKMVEGVIYLIKGTFLDNDPEAAGQLVGVLLQVYAFETGIAAKGPYNIDWENGIGRQGATGEEFSLHGPDNYAKKGYVNSNIETPNCEGYDLNTPSKDGFVQVKTTGAQKFNYKYVLKGANDLVRATMQYNEATKTIQVNVPKGMYDIPALMKKLLSEKVVIENNLKVKITEANPK